ncbi:type II toxin-antitoxin system RelB/DinJ family antitoxin [Acinetobacter piscicola]|uniref:type II toxin-antitoxin system RelB/DinJ family antitoxin n=1 Tax=Acinetobacter piscicola TaxID=2006115 RepID=UPI000B7ECE63|nr:type II toxin-antitoxin system RelB/DinJ family antitoxin [Acinetobacter piscicola]
MSSQTSMLHVRIDDETKLQAQQALKAMGLSVSDAVRIFLTRVVAEQAIPFDVRVPNAETVSAMNEADDLIQKKKARFETVEGLFNDLEKNSSR